MSLSTQRNSICPEGDDNRHAGDAIGIDSVIVNGAVVYQEATGYRDEQPGQIIVGQGR